MKKLTHADLSKTVGQEVRVIDKTFDYPDQICIVNRTNYVDITDWDNKREYTCIELQNDSFEFAYDEHGNCVDGEFEAYTAS